VKLTFVLPDKALDGKAVVVGDFNGWDPSATPLRKRGEQRSATVTVDAGRRYSFRYYSERDGWFNDDAAHDYERNEFGDDNCVIDLTRTA
jgi:1,4-alpha-glucan branching enzyme